MAQVNGSRARITTAARKLVLELKRIAVAGDDSPPKLSEIDQTKEALAEVYEFVLLVERETENEGAARALAPLGKALNDLKATGQTPRLFRRQAHNRAPDNTDLHHLKIGCAWAQCLYRAQGLSRTEASRRALRIMSSNSQKVFKIPTPRTLESWFDNCRPQGKWAPRFKGIYGRLADENPELVLTELRDIDSMLDQLLTDYQILITE